MEKVLGVFPNNSWIEAMWWRPHHQDQYSSFPGGETPTFMYPWTAHSSLCQIDDAWRNGASYGRRQGGSINYRAITTGLSFLSPSAFHH